MWPQRVLLEKRIKNNTLYPNNHQNNNNNNVSSILRAFIHLWLSLKDIYFYIYIYTLALFRGVDASHAEECLPSF